jgi:hypothetical protein
MLFTLIVGTIEEPGRFIDDYWLTCYEPSMGGLYICWSLDVDSDGRLDGTYVDIWLF